MKDDPIPESTEITKQQRASPFQGNIHMRMLHYPISYIDDIFFVSGIADPFYQRLFLAMFEVVTRPQRIMNLHVN